MKNITTRWKKLKTWQKVLYILFSLWLIDLFLGLSNTWRTVLVGMIFISLIATSMEGNTTINNTLNTSNSSSVNTSFIEDEKEYSYTFRKENKQLTGECSRSEWVYSIPDNIEKEDLGGILEEIYTDRKGETDRTNISIYTEQAWENTVSGISDISIGFLNDGFNCENERIIEIKNNYDLYNSMKNL